MNAKKIAEAAKNYFFITLGLAAFAFGWTAFMIPAELTGGGVSGISSLIYFGCGMQVAISNFIINAILIIIAWKVLGPKFCISTSICTLIVSVWFAIFQPMFPKPLVDDTFLCSLIGSFLAGWGVSVAINFGGNTGGTDIIVMIIGKFRRVAYGKITMYINVLIIASSYFIVGSVEKLVYSFVAMLAYTLASDNFIDGFRQTYQFMIFSSQNSKIAEKINTEMKRGGTFLKGTGTYSHQETEVLLVLVHKRDKTQLMRIIKQTDPTAFVSMTKTNAVFGKNFDQIQL